MIPLPYTHPYHKHTLVVPFHHCSAPSLMFESEQPSEPLDVLFFRRSKDKFKFPCKCAKWTGGLVFYGVCSSVDYLTAGIETTSFGQPLPMDAPQLMGTLLNKNDLKELQKVKKLAESMLQKSNPLTTLGKLGDN